MEVDSADYLSLPRAVRFLILPEAYFAQRQSFNADSPEDKPVFRNPLSSILLAFGSAITWQEDFHLYHTQHTRS